MTLRLCHHHPYLHNAVVMKGSAGYKPMLDEIAEKISEEGYTILVAHITPTPEGQYLISIVGQRILNWKRGEKVNGIFREKYIYRSK